MLLAGLELRARWDLHVKLLTILMNQAGGAPIGKVKPILDEFKRWRDILDQPFRQHISSIKARSYTRSELFNR